MSTFPVNGYFKQLEDYCVAVAQRANHPSQTNSTAPASNGGFPTDSVTLSSDAVELSRPVRPPDCYSYLDTLTSSDKALVKAATGWDIDANPLGDNASPSAWELVGRLNLDRACGALKGDIDPAYINRLIQEDLAPQQGQSTVQLSVLYKALAYLQGTGKQ